MTDTVNPISKRQNGNNELMNFLLYSLGLLVSLFGTNIYTFTIGLYVLKVTGSGLSFATTLVLSIIPVIIINPIAGVLADKFNRKYLVVSMDLVNGLFFIGVYFISSVYGLSLSLIYISTFVINCFTAVFNVSIDSAMPNIVSKNNLIKLNSVTKIIISISMILGPMFGGILFAFININVFIILNGISFILSGITEMFINFNFSKDNKVIEESKEDKKSTFFNEILEGYKYVVGKFEIVMIIIILIVLNFSIGFSIQIPLPFIINDVLKISSKYFGIIQSMLAVGLIIGAVILNKYSNRCVHNKIIALMNMIISGCILLMAIPVLPLISISNELILVCYYCLITIILGIAISFIDILAMSYLQKSIADNYRGRVMSLLFSLVKIILPLALILSGIFIDILPIYILLIIGSLILLLASIIWLKKYKKVM